jgi:hypothetical protein
LLPEAVEAVAGLVVLAVEAEVPHSHQVLLMVPTAPMARLTSDMAERQVVEQVVLLVMAEVHRELQVLHLLVERVVQVVPHQVAVEVEATSAVEVEVAITIVREAMAPVGVAVLTFTTLLVFQVLLDLLLRKMEMGALFSHIHLLQ